MPLRSRLIGLIGLVLLLSLGCGSLLVGWHAANSVRTELHASMDVGASTVRNGIDELAGADDRVAASRQLVATFNGNRHVRATLVDTLDRPLLTSELFVPTQRVPGWFRDLIGGEPETTRLPIPAAENGLGAIILRTDPINEIGEVWTQSRDTVLVLTGFATISALLICTVVGRALRPLETLAAAFDQVGNGHYHETVRVAGPPELMRVASGFNTMTQRLGTVAAQNRRLHERLLTLQAEERADLARDLHDEIGPLLFAVNMTAATIERTAGVDRESDISTHVRSIQDAVARMQRHVRMLLGRLRPIEVVELAVAIDRLVAFWRSRRLEIAFITTVSVEQDRIGDELNETIYRVVQEGVSNAIRHGRPARVWITIAHDDDDGIRVEVSDDGIGMTTNGAIGRDPGQLGLIGMRERVMAMAGSLLIRHGSEGRGLTIVVGLPCVDRRQSQNLGGPE
jgi:two-component system sensor histidine kinase UhpB